MSKKRQPIVGYIQYGILPVNPKKRIDVKRRALRFTFKYDSLYQNPFKGVLLRCLSREKATFVLNKAHAEVRGAHQVSLKLADQIKRLGYY